MLFAPPSSSHRLRRGPPPSDRGLDRPSAPPSPHRTPPRRCRLAYQRRRRHSPRPPPDRPRLSRWPPPPSSRHTTLSRPQRPGAGPPPRPDWPPVWRRGPPPGSRGSRHVWLAGSTPISAPTTREIVTDRPPRPYIRRRASSSCVQVPECHPAFTAPVHAWTPSRTADTPAETARTFARCRSWPFVRGLRHPHICSPPGSSPRAISASAPLRDRDRHPVSTPSPSPGSRPSRGATRQTQRGRAGLDRRQPSPTDRGAPLPPAPRLLDHRPHTTPTPWARAVLRSHRRGPQVPDRVPGSLNARPRNVRYPAGPRAVCSSLAPAVQQRGEGARPRRASDPSPTAP
jgi:hypothetical protein